MLKEYGIKMPRAVYSGSGALNKIKAFLGEQPGRVAVFTDQGVLRAGILEEPLRLIKECAGEVVLMDGLVPEPTCDQAQSAVDEFIALKADYIIAIGGGSVMDLAKLTSILADGRHSVRELIDNPGLGKKTVKTLMIPTTAGTGAEATPNSIVTVPEKELKVGIVNDEMIADGVILDGRLLTALPAKIAASTGVDALAHAVECYTSNKANPFSNLYAGEAFRIIMDNLEQACFQKDATEAKTNMLAAAFYAGAAITASGTTAVHALSYPLGGKYHIPHGVANALLLMPVMRFNRDACETELARLYDLCGMRGEETKARKSEALLERMDRLIKALPLPVSLREFGIGRADLDHLVNAGMEVRRLLDNNKKTLTNGDARSLYEEILT